MTERGSRWPSRLSQAVLLAAVLMLSVHLYRALLVQLPPLHADEAGHALPAAHMALALKHGRLAELLALTRREVVWPFLHPWFIAPFFLVGGISAAVARSSSLAAFGAASCLVTVLAREIARRSDGDLGAQAGDASHVTIGWLSVAALFGAAPWNLACTVMSESLGMALILLTLLVDARALRQGRRVDHLACGLLAALTFFTKYSYGLPLMAALLVGAIWRLGRREPRTLIYRLLAMGAPVLLWLAWQLYPDPQRGSELLRAVVNRDEGLRGLADLLFYVRALLEWLGWPVAAVVLGLFVAGLGRATRGRALTSLLFVSFTFAMLTLHPNKQSRYALPALPVLLVLVEVQLAARLSACRWRNAVWIGCALALLWARDPLRQVRVRAEEAAGLRDAHAILAFVAGQLPPGRPVLCLGSTGVLPHLALSWRLLERDGCEPQVDLLLFPDGADADQRHRRGYPPEMRPEYDRILSRALSEGHYARVVTLDFAEGSPFLPDWLAKWDKWGQNYVRRMPLQPGWNLRTEQAFPGSRATVRIYAPLDAARERLR